MKAWRVRIRVQISVLPAWREALRFELKTYYTDKKHPAWMSPQYAEDIFNRFVLKDWRKLRKTLKPWGKLKEYGIQVHRGVLR